MPSSLSDYLVTDDLTILLGLIAATVFLLQNFYKPQSLVHPILLGRQSDVARVRNPGESAVYRNYGIGLMGTFPLRPSKDVHVLSDLIRTDFDAPRTLWNTKITNPALQDRVAAFGTGLLRLVGLERQESNALLLLNDCLEFIISDMALAAHSIPSFTLTQSNLLASVLEMHPPSAIITHAELLAQLLELIYEEGDARNHTIIVVGEPSAQVMATVASKVKVLKFEDVEREGVKNEKIMSPIPKPSDVFSVSFFALESGQLQGVQLTHENVTAGIAAMRHLLPPSQAFSSQDTIASAHNAGSAFGRTIAYTAIYEGCNFATMDSSTVFQANEILEETRFDVKDVLSVQRYPIPSPTIIFIKPMHNIQLQEEILTAAQSNWFIFPFAWRQKMAAIREGFFTKDSLWDRLVFDGARASVIGDMAGTLRAVIVSGARLPTSFLTVSRIAFSTPFVNLFSYPVVAGPVLASHPLDVQDFTDASNFSRDQPPTPVGAPAINIEAKLVGVSDREIEQGGDPEGVLLVRGPAVGKLLSAEDYVDIPRGDEEKGGGWVGTGVKAKVHPNGAFRIVSEY